MVLWSNCIVSAYHKVVKGSTQFLDFLRHPLYAKSLDEFLNWHDNRCDPHNFFHIIPFEIFDEYCVAPEVQISLYVLFWVIELCPICTWIFFKRWALFLQLLENSSVLLDPFWAKKVLGEIVRIKRDRSWQEQGKVWANLVLKEPLCDEGGRASNKLDVSLLDCVSVEPIIYMMVNNVFHFWGEIFQRVVKLIEIYQCYTFDCLQIKNFISKSKPLLVDSKFFQVFNDFDS